jgi:hypothetical protein
MKNKDQQLIWETYLKEEDVQREFPGTPEREPLTHSNLTYINRIICSLVITYRDTGFDQDMAREWIRKTFEQGKHLKVFGWRPEFEEIIDKCFEQNWTTK